MNNLNGLIVVVKKERAFHMLHGTPMTLEDLEKAMSEAGIFELTQDEFDKKIDEFLENYLKHLTRIEVKQHFKAVFKGLISSLKSKNSEAIALAFQGAAQVKNQANFFTRSLWDTGLVLSAHQEVVHHQFKEQEVMLTIDSTSIQKKGKETAGAAPQYHGLTGHISNNVTSVFAGITSESCHTLIDFEMFIPELWFTDDYEDRCKKCKMPEDMVFKTKLEIAIEIATKTVNSGLYKITWIGADGFFGRSYEFRNSLPKGIYYFLDVAMNMKVFRTRPTMAVPEYSGKGKIPTKEQPSEESITVKELANDPAHPWNYMVVGIGSKGPNLIKDKLIKVVECNNDTPGKDLWLYVKELENGDIRYALCNYPFDGDVAEIRKAATMRWTIEQSFRDIKTNVGMDQYQVRSYPGWERHTLISLIASWFLTTLVLENMDSSNAKRNYPIIEQPITLEEYLEAYDSIQKGEPIENPSLKDRPSSPQPFFTMGTIKRLISPFVDKCLNSRESAIYYLKSMARSFASALKSKKVKMRVMLTKKVKEAKKQAKLALAGQLVESIIG
jgi:SRSO17 transposase